MSASYDYRALLTVDALFHGETDLFMYARRGGVVELMLTERDGLNDPVSVVATLTAEEAATLQHMLLCAANVAAQTKETPA